MLVNMQSTGKNTLAKMLAKPPTGSKIPFAVKKNPTRPVQLYMAKKYNLTTVTNKDKGALWKIVQNSKTMQWIANGKPWDSRKLTRFINYCAKEAKQQKPKYNYWSINIKNVCRGIVGIHPIKYDRAYTREYFVTIFLEQGQTNQGVGTFALRRALSKFAKTHPNTPVYIDARVDNAPMQHLAKKLGFMCAGSIWIKDSVYLRLVKYVL